MSDKEQNNSFLLELVSPERVLSSEDVSFVVLPASEGGIGVLPGHAPLLTSMKPGVIEIHPVNDNAPKKVFVSGGFIDVNQTICTVLALDAQPLEELNQTEIEKQIEELNNSVFSAQDDIEKNRLETLLTIEKAKLQSLTGILVA